MTRPSESRFLAGALNPRPKSRLRKADLEALAEEAEAEAKSLTGWNRIPTPLSNPGHRLSSDPHYSTLLPDPLSKSELEAVPEQLEVWATYPGRPTEFLTAHRVSPMTLFGLSWGVFPTELQTEFAKAETLRLAQRTAWNALLEGARRVEIRPYSRKAASSRFSAGPVIHGRPYVLTSLADSVIDGEPLDKSIESDL